MQYNRQGKIKVPPYVAFIVLAGMLIWYVSGGLTVSHNNAALANAVKAIPEDVSEVSLNDIVPFEWGAVYTFEPYTTKSEIMELTGLTAGTIAETTSEGQLQLLFVTARRSPRACAATRAAWATMCSSRRARGTASTPSSPRRITRCSPFRTRTASSC